ncbi:MAG: hypothetical protein JWN78_520 [Bacteroidota bacterium]|nr:hypothetical protein [Bacteroidota bacterium]
MIVYTITANIEAPVAQEWKIWMQNKFLPIIMDTGLFEKYIVFKVLNDNDGETITFQFFCKDIIVFKKFQDEHKAKVVQLLTESFPDKVVYFNTLLQQLDV